jgi:hypothetical protein
MDLQIGNGVKTLKTVAGLYLSFEVHCWVESVMFIIFTCFSEERVGF